MNSISRCENVRPIPTKAGLIPAFVMLNQKFLCFLILSEKKIVIEAPQQQDQDTSKGKAENHAEAWTNDETTAPDSTPQQNQPRLTFNYPTRSSQQFIVGTRKVWGKNFYVN